MDSNKAIEFAQLVNAVYAILDVAANTNFKNPTVYTYASPRTGDPSFASTYNQVVQNSFRVDNRADLGLLSQLAGTWQGKGFTSSHGRTEWGVRRCSLSSIKQKRH